MNTIDSKQATIFIVVFSVIALLINGTQGFGVTQSAMPVSASVPSAAEQAAQNVAAEHAKYLARYLNGSLNRQAGSRGVAIVVANETGTFNLALTTALARRFQGPSVQIFQSMFTPEFVSDGLFNEAVAGSRDLFRKLDLASGDTLVLAREDVQYAQNPALENIITATIQLDVNVVPVSGQGGGLSWTFTANGPGFSNAVARKAAEERLIKQIANDTKMSLN